MLKKNEKISSASISNCLIIGIRTIMLYEILLEIHFKLECSLEKRYLSFAITDDAETIKIGFLDSWELEGYDDEAYHSNLIGQAEPLGILLNNRILSIKFAVGKSLDANTPEVYYIILQTDQKNVLLFNNGDEAGFAFNNLDKIIEYDIYDFEWKDEFVFNHP